MLTVAEVVTRAALERRETRGGHSRTDYPQTDPAWGRVNVVVRKLRGELVLDRVPIPEMPAELRALLEVTR
jgi:succinate dehydrogenase / fumarate reductase flavoprotein subunit